jgi:hypothetical protein
MVKIFYYFGHDGCNFVYTIIYMNSRLELDNWYNVAVSNVNKVMVMPSGVASGPAVPPGGTRNFKTK